MKRNWSMLRHTLSTALQTPAEHVATDPALGLLPVWKLSDLYPSREAPEFKADMERAGMLCSDFETKWKGKLADAASKTGTDGLGQALADYETLEDLLGRIGSFAGLTYFSDTSNPANGKFYGMCSRR
jgi:oligoendopeptidase F